jgi:lysozyme
MALDRLTVDFVKAQEGLRLSPYQDVAGHWTIGYGHRCRAEQASICVAAADAWLLSDLRRAAEVVDIVPGLSCEQRAALVSFVFNIGRGAFLQSTLCRKLRDGDMAGAAAEFDRWRFVRAGSEMMESKGLRARRARERELFERGMKDGLVESANS